jgi:hypothetical protein
MVSLALRQRLRGVCAAFASRVAQTLKKLNTSVFCLLTSVICYPATSPMPAPNPQ